MTYLLFFSFFLGPIRDTSRPEQLPHPHSCREYHSITALARLIRLAHLLLQLGDYFEDKTPASDKPF